MLRRMGDLPTVIFSTLLNFFVRYALLEWEVYLTFTTAVAAVPVAIAVLIPPAVIRYDSALPVTWFCAADVVLVLRRLCLLYRAHPRTPLLHSHDVLVFVPECDGRASSAFSALPFHVEHL